MIIRYFPQDREKLEKALSPLREEKHRLENQLISLDEEHFIIIDGIREPISKEAKEISQKISRIQLEMWETGERVRKSIEDKRFENMKNAPQKIMKDAKIQTDAIMNAIRNAVDLRSPGKKTTKQLTTLNKEIEPLQQIWDKAIFSEITQAAGETAKLDSKKITDMIKKNLFRHYSRLNAEQKRELTKYIKGSVSDLLESQTGNSIALSGEFLKIYRNSAIEAIPRITSKQIQSEVNEDGSKNFFAQIDKERIDLDDDLIKCGIEIHKLITVAESFFYLNPNSTEVKFSMIDYLTITRENPSLDKESLKKYKKLVDGYQKTMLKMSIPYEVESELTKKKKEEGIEIDSEENYAANSNLFYNAMVNIHEIIIEFNPLLAMALKISPITQYPAGLLKIEQKYQNAYRIGYKLCSYRSTLHNVSLGKQNIIGIMTLLNVTDLPYNSQDTSHFRRDVIEKFNGFLDMLRDKYNILDEWYLIRPKRGEQTPQERRIPTAETENIYNTPDLWKNCLIYFELKNMPDLTTALEEYEKRRLTGTEGA